MSRAAGPWRLVERDGVWYVTGTEDGRWFRRSTKTGDKREALAIMKDWQKEPKKMVRHDAPVTFDDLAEALENRYRINGHRAVASMQDRVNHLRAAFGDKIATDITAVDCERYMASRMGPPARASKATVRYEMTLLRLALRLRGIPRPDVKLPDVSDNARTGFLEPEQRERVLALLPDDVRPLATALALMGWRPAEVNGLRWRDIDFKRGVVRVEAEHVKNREAKEWPIGSHPRLLALFQDQRKRALRYGVARPDCFVFFRTGRDGAPEWPDQLWTPVVETIRKDGTVRRLGGKPRTTGIPSFRKCWKAACKKAGVPGTLVYDLKRSTVRDLEASGIPRKVAMTITGHRTEAIYRRYHIVNDADQRAAVAKLAVTQQMGMDRGSEAVGAGD